MKQFILLLLVLASFSSYGQDKYSHIHFNKLTPITGTSFVMASIDDRGKMEVNSKHLLFINTQTGETTQLDLPAQARIGKIEQVHLPALDINKLILSARTLSLAGKSDIGWEDPEQVFILSTDGKDKTQLTENGFFTREWAINEQTGALVITGYLDSNNNKRQDPKDENQILIFDLKTNKQLHQL